MLPIFKIGDHDYTEYIQELKPSTNDLDADGSGRNILDGLMYRKRIGTKAKYTVSFLRLTETMMAQLRQDMAPEYVRITTLDSSVNRHVERVYYCSSINDGIQRVIGGITVYDGTTFDIIER